MTYGNLIKNKIQHVISGLFDTLSIKRKLTKEQMKCTQFGICDYAQGASGGSSLCLLLICIDFNIKGN